MAPEKIEIEVKFGVSGDWLPALWDGRNFLDPKGLVIQTPDMVRFELPGYAFFAEVAESAGPDPYARVINWVARSGRP